MVAQADTVLPDGIQQKLNEIGVTLKSLQEIKARYQQGKLTEEYLRFVMQYYEQAQVKGRIRSLAGAIFKALTTDQLTKEFDQWKASQPVYIAPKPKQTSSPREEVIQLEELRSGWEIMNKKGLSTYSSFEDSLVEYQKDPAYRIEVRDGKECLIYSSK